MADDVDITYHGDRVLTVLEATLWHGLEAAAEHLLQVSSDRAPHEEGDLERSGTTTPDEANNRVSVSFDRPYARRQHEELTWRHDPGKTAKYLEDPMNEERPTMLRIIAKAGRKATGAT